MWDLDQLFHFITFIPIMYFLGNLFSGEYKRRWKENKKRKREYYYRMYTKQSSHDVDPSEYRPSYPVIYYPTNDEQTENGFIFQLADKRYMHMVNTMKKRYTVLEYAEESITVCVNGHKLKHIPSTDTYIVDGMEVPSAVKAAREYMDLTSMFHYIDMDFENIFHCSIRDYELGLEYRNFNFTYGYRRLKERMNPIPLGMNVYVVVCDKIGIPVCADVMPMLLFDNSFSHINTLDIWYKSPYRDIAILKNTLVSIGIKQCFDVDVDTLLYANLGSGSYSIASLDRWKDEGRWIIEDLSERKVEEMFRQRVQQMHQRSSNLQNQTKQ